MVEAVTGTLTVIGPLSVVVSCCSQIGHEWYRFRVTFVLVRPSSLPVVVVVVVP